jgi:hypothetical protein
LGREQEGVGLRKRGGYKRRENTWRCGNVVYKTHEMEEGVGVRRDFKRRKSKMGERGGG